MAIGKGWGKDFIPFRPKGKDRPPSLPWGKGGRGRPRFLLKGAILEGRRRTLVVTPPGEKKRGRSYSPQGGGKEKKKKREKAGALSVASTCSTKT